VDIKFPPFLTLCHLLLTSFLHYHNSHLNAFCTLPLLLYVFTVSISPKEEIIAFPCFISVFVIVSGYYGNFFLICAPQVIFFTPFSTLVLPFRGTTKNLSSTIPRQQLLQSSSDTLYYILGVLENFFIPLYPKAPPSYHFRRVLSHIRGTIGNFASIYPHKAPLTQNLPQKLYLLPCNFRRIRYLFLRSQNLLIFKILQAFHQRLTIQLNISL